MKSIKINGKVCVLSIIAYLCLIFNANAQYKKTPVGLSPEIMAWTTSTMDSLSYKQYASLKDAMRDNNFYIPLVFRGGMFPEIGFKPDICFSSLRIPALYKFDHKEVDNLFQSYLLRKSLQDNAYKEVMLKDPTCFRYAFNRLPGWAIKPASIERSINGVKVAVTPVSVEPDDLEKIVKFIPDRKYWISSFLIDLKFSQNKTSSNWYSGEINNMNIFENIIISYNYAKDRITLTNTLSNIITVNNAPNDSVHFYTLGSNELRFRTNFGLKAAGAWSYSASGEFITPILNKYLPNSEALNSTFLSPFTVNVGVGMTFAKVYKYETPHKQWDLQLSIEPLSFKYMYSRNEKIDLAAYFSQNSDGTFPCFFRSFGSTFTLNSKVNFNRYVDLTSRLYYFTNYERVISEFENKLNIALSRYFSTMVYLYLRYDDGVAKLPSESHLQVNEMFSFGFTYKW